MRFDGFLCKNPLHHPDLRGHKQEHSQLRSKSSKQRNNPSFLKGMLEREVQKRPGTGRQGENQQRQNLKVHPPDLPGSRYTGGNSLQHLNMDTDAQGLPGAIPDALDRTTGALKKTCDFVSGTRQDRMNSPVLLHP